MAWSLHEPLRATLVRTIGLALAIGGVLALVNRALVWWPIGAYLASWFTFGGHWVEVAFLDVLRPRLPAAGTVRVLARIAIWFAGGVLLGYAITRSLAWFEATAALRPPPVWLGGVAFIGVELVVHLGLRLRARPSFYDGRG
jgi:hypothetical protein